MGVALLILGKADLRKRNTYQRLERYDMMIKGSIFPKRHTNPKRIHFTSEGQNTGGRSDKAARRNRPIS